MCSALNLDSRNIDTLFSEYDQGRLPGVAVGIAVCGAPVYRRGFGLANMELPLPLAPTMRMRIGSTSKQFTALAWLLLCEEGRASLDDPIGKYLPELHPSARDVTALHLLSNNSGLRDAYDIVYQFCGTGQRVSTDDIFELYRAIDTVNAPPGRRWLYNNGGFMLMALAIERVTGMSLEDVLRERIFIPIGMHDTVLRRWDSDFLPNSAALHMSAPGGGFEKSYLGTASAGQGGIVSTVDDMLRWLKHMDSPYIGSAESWRAMHTPQRLRNDYSSGYGLGLFLGSHDSLTTINHPGGVMGGSCQMIKVPALQLDVIVMANRHDVSAPVLAHRVIDELVGAAAVAVAPEPRPIEGVFRSPTSGRVAIMSTVGSVPHIQLDGVDIPLVADGGESMVPVPEYGLFKLAIRRSAQAFGPDLLEIEDFGDREHFLPIAEGPRQAMRIAGRFGIPNLQIEVAIDGSDVPTMSASGPFGRVRYDLAAIGPDIWRATTQGVMPWGGIFAFDEREDALLFTTARNRSLRLRRL